MTDTRSIEARRIIEGIRHHRRGLRRLENGEREQAKASAAAIAELAMNDVHRLNLTALFDMAASATMEALEHRAKRYQARHDAGMDQAMSVMSGIMEGGREEEARRVRRLADAAPWYRRRGVIRKAETRLAEFVGMVKAAQLSYGEAEYQEAVADIRARMAGATQKESPPVGSGGAMEA